MRRTVLLLAGFLAMAALAQEEPTADETSAEAADAVVTDAPSAPDESGVIYRSVGEDGSIVFSDQPSPGAQKMQVQEPQTIEAPPPPSFVYERSQAESSIPYRRIEILDPANDAQIRENTGNVTVTVAMDPSLLGSDELVLLMDGQEMASGSDTTFNLENVDRGTHQLSAVVRGPGGKTLMSSPAVTFHMLRYFEPPAKPAPPKPKPKSK